MPTNSAFFERKDYLMFQPPPPPFPPASPYLFYPVPTAHLGYRALKHLVQHLPPPQSYAEWVYHEALRTELRSRRWQLFFALIPRA